MLTDSRYRELDPGFAVTAETEEIADFADGATVSFQPRALQSGHVLGGLTIQANGVNAEGEELMFSGGFHFTNDCGSFPVLTNGDSIGWVVLVGIILATGTNRFP